jgi:hypothetical protein
MNFEVESKYPIDIFKNNDLEVSWNTIKVGYDLDRLTSDEVGRFAVQYLETHSDLVNEYIFELILGIKKEDVSTDIKKVFTSLGLKMPEKNTPEWNKEWYKWRYCIANEMVKSITNEEELLERIEGVYADFGYPEDMSSFIYYMPQEENIPPVASHVARSSLIAKIKKFIAKEKTRLLLNENTEKLPASVVFGE